MKIGIYDKWLNSMGGGEKVATVMAEALSIDGYSVDLISNSDIEKQEVEQKMGVNLSHVNLIFWAERSYKKLEELTKKYNIFINVSFLDHLPSKAKWSIYYVHFPTPIKSSIFGFLKYETILPFLRRVLIIPEFTQGLEYIDEINFRGGKWLKKVNTLILNNPDENLTVKFRIYAEKLTLKSLDSVRFQSPNANISVLDKHIDHKSNVLIYKVFANLKSKQNLILRILIDNNYYQGSFGLVSMTIQNIRYVLWNWMKRYLPNYEMALYGSSTYKPAEGLRTYNTFLSNSRFTQFWVKKYWEKDSKVLYPPVDVEEFKPAKKKNIILSVGRFFVGGHTKRQDVLVKVFKQMTDKGYLKGWELHLVGGVASGEDHRSYLNQIRDESIGYPIYFHLSASFTELKRLYSQAKIYWHAAGYSESTKPEPITFEHFGITIVEAMAAGCIPVVFEGGGVVETVGTSSGLTWKETEELSQITKDLIENGKKMRRLSLAFVGKAKKFSRGNFAKNLLEIIGDLLKNNHELGK